MNYQQTLDYLFRQLPMYQRVGAVAFKKDLTNTWRLCDFLDHPEKKIQSIHVAGTNGKGSTCHMLSAMLQAAGHTVGLYSSPHLKSFRERIKINRVYINEPEVVRFVKKVKPIIDEIHPSFFEITVAMAFDYFAMHQPDIVIMETGMGGRFDSTNVITPLLSIITNIDFDHQQFLGNTLEAIAYEKAGIIKPGIPALIGDRHEQTEQVFCDKATDVKSPLYFADSIVGSTVQTADKENLTLAISGKLDIEDLEVGTGARYQQDNVITALAAMYILRDLGYFEWEETHIRKGLKSFAAISGLQGRWQILGHNPFILADCAHNQHGLKVVLNQLESYTFSRRHFVLGFVNDKDVPAALSLFPKDGHYYCCQLSIPRAMPVGEIIQHAQHLGLKAKPYPGVGEALKEAKKNAAGNDLIYIGGSSFTVAEL